MWSPNRWEWLVTQFATARIGLVLVNINPAYRLAELEYALNKVGCKALVTADKFKTSDYLGMIADAGAGTRDARSPASSRPRSCRISKIVIRMGEDRRPACSISATCWRWAAPRSAARWT